MVVDVEQIPEHWEVKTIDDVIQSSLYGCNPTTGEDIDGTPYLRISDISEDGGLKYTELPERAKFEDKEDRKKYLLSDGDIVIARSGASSGQSYVYYPEHGEMVYASYLIRFTLNQDIVSKRYIREYLKSPIYWNQVAEAKKGAAQNNINAGNIKSFKIPLPPLSEQEHIVDKIDEQLSKLRVGTEELAEAKQRLSRYRGSVLERAVEGSLTAEWRSTRKFPEFESEIKQIAKNVSSPDDLPESWYQCSLENIVDFIDYRGRTPPYSDDGIPHLRSSNVKEGRIVWDDLKYVSEETYDEYMNRGIPKEGDILFTTEGPLGNAAPVPSRKFCLAQRLMVLRPLKVLNSKYLMYYILSPGFQSELRKEATGTTVKGISQKNLRPLKIVVPPLSEQEEIVNMVKQYLSIQEESLRNIEESIDRASNLRKSILMQAFEGKLVTSEVDDGSITEIQDERVNNENQQRGGQMTLSEVSNDAQ